MYDDEMRWFKCVMGVYVLIHLYFELEMCFVILLRLDKFLHFSVVSRDHFNIPSFNEIPISHDLIYFVSVYLSGVMGSYKSKEEKEVKPEVEVLKEKDDEDSKSNGQQVRCWGLNDFVGDD